MLALLLAGPSVTSDVLGVLRRPWRIELQARQFDFLRDHWDELMKRTDPDFATQFAPYVCDRARRDEVVGFLKSKLQPLPEYGDRAAAIAVDSMDRCIAENAALAPAVAAWLRAK